MLTEKKQRDPYTLKLQRYPTEKPQNPQTKKEHAGGCNAMNELIPRGTGNQ